MDAETFRTMNSTGQDYWWYQGKKAIIRRLAQANNIKPGGRVLDLGCGTGTLFKFLEGWGNVTGLELSADAIILAKEKTGASLVRASTDAIPFKNNSFPLIVVFDCLEHLRDDSGALLQIRELLAPGGKIVISVPAFRFLSSWRDIQLAHMRRYTKSSLTEVIEGAGFQINQMMYGYFCLFLPLVFKALKDKLKPAPKKFNSDIAMLAEPWNGMLASWLKLESAVGTRWGLPVGTSIFCVAQERVGG